MMYLQEPRTLFRHCLYYFLVFFSTIFLSLMAWQTPQIASANESYATHFQTNLVTTYVVNEGGQTRVTHEFTITNLQPLYSVSNYALQVNSLGITDITVKNAAANQSAIPFQFIATDTASTIALTFSDQVVGEGKERRFTIAYTDPDAARITGKVLEVAVPRIQNPTEYHSYTVHLITPVRYGTPSKTNPEVFTTANTESGLKTSFEENHFTGITAIYGDEQVFSIDLAYYLENTHSNNRLAQIALPPDTAFQHVAYTNLDPKPQTITQDVDGNWIATYQLPATSSLTVQAQLLAQITLEPNTQRPRQQPLPAHSRPTEHWQSQSSKITAIAQSLPNPAAIYNFTSQTLSYNHDLISEQPNRLGAEAALNQPDQALCQEFTDVFVALARANDIPARRLTGYAHTENTRLRPLSLANDILHAWPEYYDESNQLWRPVDPTWGNTSGGLNYFDQIGLNHIVFAINGESSQRPYPAGSYKKNGIQSKDVAVSFAEVFDTPNPDFSFHIQKSALAFIPFWQPPQLILENKTGTAWYNQTFIINSTAADVVWPTNEWFVETILPFEAKTQTILLFQDGIFLPTTGTITIHHDSETTTITGSIYPSYWRWGFNAFTILGMVIGGVSIALITGSVLVFKRRQ